MSRYPIIATVRYPTSRFWGWGVLIIIGISLDSASAGAAPQLLLTIPGHVAGGSDSTTPVQELTFTLFFGGPQGFPVPPWPIRFGELSVNALPLGSGVFSFNATNTSTFGTFAELATDGNPNDVLVEGVETLRYSSGGYYADTEASYQWSSSTWYNLDEVRLVLDMLSVSPDAKSYETDYRWELWGSSIPEPSALLCVIAAYAALHSRRNPSRHSSIIA
jgi:hypothetical protein